MRFLWPESLWLLFALPLAVVAYVWLLKRRRHSAVLFSNLEQVKRALGPQRRWRRHVPPALVLAALALSLVAVARPSATVTLPSEYLTLVLAIDVSRSMRAADVEPDRITAAQAAAKSFIEELPKNVRVGIVTFAGTAQVVQTITEKRDELIEAIDRFQLQRATATGSGLLVALGLMFPDDQIDVEDAVFGSGFSRQGRDTTQGRRGAGPSAPGDQSVQRTEQYAGFSAKKVDPVPPGSYSAGAIILLSDGRRTTGPDPIDAAKLAADRGVRVYTVGFGTKQGASVDVEGYSYYMRLDEDTLKAVARMTAAEYFHAGTAADLRKVYENLSLKFALEKRETEVSALFAAAAAIMLMAALGLSLWWFRPRA